MISTTTANDGVYDWTVPATLATGSSYFIRVRTADNLISDSSDKFSVIVPAITVTAPGLGTVWAKGTGKTIAWNKVGTQDANVKIQLFRGASRTLDITLNTPNSGSFDWAIPASLANAVYTIRITTLDGRVKGSKQELHHRQGIDPGQGAGSRRALAAGRGPHHHLGRRGYAQCQRQDPIGQREPGFDHRGHHGQRRQLRLGYPGQPGGSRQLPHPRHHCGQPGHGAKRPVQHYLILTQPSAV